MSIRAAAEGLIDATRRFKESAPECDTKTAFALHTSLVHLWTMVLEPDDDGPRLESLQARRDRIGRCNRGSKAYLKNWAIFDSMLDYSRGLPWMLDTVQHYTNLLRANERCDLNEVLRRTTILANLIEKN